MPNTIDRLTSFFGRLSRRELIMVLGLSATFAVLIVALLSYLTFDGIESRRMANDRLRVVIDKIEKNRPRLMTGQEEDTQATAKLDRKPPALQAHLDALAGKLEVEIKNYKLSEPKAIGPKKEVTEQAVVVSLYDIDLDKLMKLLSAVETGSHYLVTTELSVTPRSGQHDRLDVKTLRVSSYEWSKESATPAKTKGTDAKPKKDQQP
jgi:hypothetical protein